MTDAYLDFLREKMCLARFSGFDVPLEEINPALKPHTRAIERWSMPGEVVYDPFHGLGTVGVRAIKLGRRARGSELSAAYFADQVHYLLAAELEESMPSLFDFVEPALSETA